MQPPQDWPPPPVPPELSLNLSKFVLLSSSSQVFLLLSVGTGHMLNKSRLADKKHPIAHHEMKKTK